MTDTDQNTKDPQVAAMDKHFRESVLPARIRLYQEIRAALDSLDAAGTTLGMLGTNDAFDVEYEGGGRFADHLAEARRILVIAKALMPTDENGEYVDRDIRNDAVDALMSGTYLK